MNTVSGLTFSTTLAPARACVRRNASPHVARALHASLLSVLFLAPPCAWAQESGTITFKGVVAEATAAADEYGHVVTQDDVPPHRIDVKAYDDLATPRLEALDYFAQRYREAGIASSRIRLMTLDYL